MKVLYHHELSILRPWSHDLLASLKVQRGHEVAVDFSTLHSLCMPILCTEVGKMEGVGGIWVKAFPSPWEGRMAIPRTSTWSAASDGRWPSFEKTWQPRQLTQPSVAARGKAKRKGPQRQQPRRQPKRIKQARNQGAGRAEHRQGTGTAGQGK